MRKIIIIGVLVVAVVVAIPVGAFVTTRNASVDVCGAGGVSQALTGPAPKVQGLTSAQVRLAQIIWSRANRHAKKLDGKPDQAAVIAIAVASQESTLGAHPAINRPNRDGDAGPFQQRAKPGWYGTLAEVTDSVYAADTFLLGHTVTAAQHAAAMAARSQPAGPVGYHIPGLANVASWASLDTIDAAHRVQRSAFPDAIADDLPVARRLVDRFTSDSTASADGAEVAAIEESEPADCGSEATPTRCPPTDSPGEQGLKPDTLLVPHAPDRLDLQARVAGEQCLQPLMLLVGEHGRHRSAGCSGHCGAGTPTPAVTAGGLLDPSQDRAAQEPDPERPNRADRTTRVALTPESANPQLERR